ncbi:hypothetical protein EVAR_2913_1 [Eumeta japonica]|uniref:Uncharacterized protein n=1 Tax=Eumeta variegata TaxID=151549 RepID=A0A4C1T1N1_EUMVA|nr:hypothetical protein EVAR_2913_1 [Eumeta japonica]
MPRAIVPFQRGTCAPLKAEKAGPRCGRRNTIEFVILSAHCTKTRRPLDSRSRLIYRVGVSSLSRWSNAGREPLTTVVTDTMTNSRTGRLMCSRRHGRRTDRKSDRNRGGLEEIAHSHAKRRFVPPPPHPLQLAVGGKRRTP